MADLVERIRAALDEHSRALDAYEQHRAVGPHLNYEGQDPEAYDGYDSCYLCIATGAARGFADVAFGRRMVAAHRKILDYLALLDEWALDNNLWALPDTDKARQALAEAYGVEA